MEDSEAKPHRSLSSLRGAHSSMSAVEVRVSGFESRQSRSGENRRRFCETNPIFWALQITPVRAQRKARKPPPPVSSHRTEKRGLGGRRAQLATEGCRPRVHRRERWRTRRAPSKAAKAEAVRARDVLRETNPSFLALQITPCSANGEVLRSRHGNNFLTLFSPISRLPGVIRT